MTKILTTEQKKSKKIIWARHAQYTGNILGINNSDPTKKIPLTATGIQQAFSLGTELKKFKINTIYTSDFLRAQQTAAIINDHFTIPAKIIIDSNLNEFQLGEDFEGKPHIEYFSKNIDFINHQLPNKENFSKVLKRLLTFIRSIDKSTDSLIITHGYLLQGVQYLLGLLTIEEASKGINLIKNAGHIITYLNS
jgi:broad specificity phosphatase PhoE